MRETDSKNGTAPCNGVGGTWRSKCARIAPSYGRVFAGHYGLGSDSSCAVRLVAVSRLVRSRDESILEAAARTPTGLALLDALRAAMLRVAVLTHGGGGGGGSAVGPVAALTEANVATLFNMSASTIANRRLYDAGLALPSRLPHAAAKELLGGLLSGLAEMRATTSAGYHLGERLLRPNASRADAHAHADDFAAAVLHAEASMAAASRPVSGAASSAASAASAASSSSGASSPSVPPTLPPLPAVVAPHPSAEAHPTEPLRFAIDASLSLRANVERLLGRRMHRALDAAERHAVDVALDESLSLLQAGGAAARKALLDASILSALGSPGGAAQIWASAMEVTTEEGEATQSVAALAAALVSACSTVAAVLFASAIGF